MDAWVAAIHVIGVVRVTFLYLLLPGTEPAASFVSDV